MLTLFQGAKVRADVGWPFAVSTLRVSFSFFDTLGLWAWKKLINPEICPDLV